MCRIQWPWTWNLSQKEPELYLVFPTSSLSLSQARQWTDFVVDRIIDWLPCPRRHGGASKNVVVLFLTAAAVITTTATTTTATTHSRQHRHRHPHPTIEISMVIIRIPITTSSSLPIIRNHPHLHRRLWRCRRRRRRRIYCLPIWVIHSIWLPWPWFTTRTNETPLTSYRCHWRQENSTTTKNYFLERWIIFEKNLEVSVWAGRSRWSYFHQAITITITITMSRFHQHQHQHQRTRQEPTNKNKKSNKKSNNNPNKTNHHAPLLLL